MNAATRLTVSRLAMGPLFFLAFAGYRPSGVTTPAGSIIHPLLALAIIIASELTDFFDGRIARRLGTDSLLGELLDGFADSLARLSFLTCFWALRLVPSWMVLIAYYHDASGFFLRNLASGQNLVLRRRTSGRVMEAMLAALAPVVVGSMILWHLLQPAMAWSVVEQLAWWATLAVGIVAVFSAVDYVVGNADELRRIQR